MLRIHSTNADLVRPRIASAPDPLWEICASLHRFSSGQGCWAYADWHRTVGPRLHSAGFGRTLRALLKPLVPRAVYFPVAPYGDRIQARVEAERSARARAVLATGPRGSSQRLGPMLQWRRPVLHTHPRHHPSRRRRRSHHR